MSIQNISTESLHWQRLTHLIIASVIGGFTLIINSLVLIFSLFLPSLKGKEYRIYLFNLAIIDSIFIVSALLSNQVVPHSSPLCSFNGILSLGLGFSMLHAILPIVVNRFLNICQTDLNDRWFKSRRTVVVAFCVYPYIAGFLPILPLGMAANYGPGRFGLICLVDGSVVALTVAFLLNQLFVYGLLIFCSWELRKKIKEMELTQLGLQRRKVKETKYLLKATFIQAVSPVLLQAPCSILYLQPAVTEVTKWINVFTVCLFICTALVDGLATLFFVEPYRRALKSCLSFVRCSGNNRAAVAPVPPKEQENLNFELIRTQR